MNRFFRGVLMIAAKDLRLEGRRQSGFAAMLVLAVAIVLVFAFCFGLPSIKRLGPERLVPAVLWIALLFASLGGFRQSFSSERDRDTLAALLMSPLDPSALFLGKLLANLVLVFLLEAALLPLTAIVFDWPLFSALGPVAGVVALHTLGIVTLGTLFAALVTRLGQSEAFLAVLVLPLTVPLIISAGKTTQAAVALRPLSELQLWLGLTGMFDAIALAAAVLVFESLVEE